MINLFIEQPYIDLWTLAHLSFGMILFFYLKHKNIWASNTIIFLTAFFWEIFEINLKVFEYPTNRISDIIFTFIGFYVMSAINDKNIINKKDVIITFLIINILGWLSYVFL